MIKSSVIHSFITVRKTYPRLLYYPNSKDPHSAMSQFGYELRCCHGLMDALAILHHPRQHRITCQQAEALFLLFGSPGK